MNDEQFCRGIAATASPPATDAAVSIFRKGGNAIDAAVAAALALSVCEPGNSGLGGQTVLLIRLASGETIVLDGHSRAPAAVSSATVSLEDQRFGHRACTIPSTPAVLELAHRRFGRLKWCDLFEPAIQLADNGYEISELQHNQLKWCLPMLVESPSGNRHFLKNGQPYDAGNVFRQPNLARALQRIAKHGAADFYRGAIARAIAGDMRSNGGLLTEADLASMAPAERQPMFMRMPDFDIFTAPPPAGGFLLLLGLRLLKQSTNSVADPFRWYEMIGEVTHAVFSERERLSHRLDELSDQQLLDLLEKRSAEIGDVLHSKTAQRLTETETDEAGETTHLCTADSKGNIVALTQSLQTLYGSKAVCPEYGILYNNYLVTCPREEHPHQLNGGCRPRSNSAPSLVVPRIAMPTNGTTMLQDNANKKAAAGRFATGTSARLPFLTLGAAGSRRSLSALLHTFSGVFDRKLSLAEAVAVPRLHVLLDRNAWLEDFEQAQQLMQHLCDRFGQFQLRRHQSYAMGCVQAIKLSEDGTVVGVADPRRDGTAEMYCVAHENGR